MMTDTTRSGGPMGPMCPCGRPCPPFVGWQPPAPDISRLMSCRASVSDEGVLISDLVIDFLSDLAKAHPMKRLVFPGLDWEAFKAANWPDRAQP